MTNNTPLIESQLAEIAKKFHKIEGEGLKQDIEQGRLIRKALQVLKDEGRLCAFVTDVLGTNMMRVRRLRARARAADLVPFNALLKLKSRTAIDHLAAGKVPDGAILEAVEMSNERIRITEEIAKEIADKHLEAAGRKRRKPRKKKPQSGDEVTLVNSPICIARHLSNYQPEIIYRVADAAVGQAMRDGTNWRNSNSLLDAVQWVKPALPNPTAIKAGLATDYFLVRDGFVSAFNGSLLARSPCAQNGTFMVCAGILEGWLVLEKWRDEEPQVRLEDDRVRFDIPDDDGEYALIPQQIESFAPKDPGLIDRYPNGERHAVPVELTVALASLWRLTGRAPGHRMESGVWLFDGGALVINPPLMACVQDVGVKICPALKVGHDVLRKLMKCRLAPRELFVDSDLWWLRWPNGDHIAAPKVKASESETDVLAGAIALLERYRYPAVAIKCERPTVFERTNGLASLSVQLRPDGLCANAAAAVGHDASTGANDLASKSNGKMDFSSCANLLPFRYDNVVGLIGLSDASDRETVTGDE